MSTGKKQQWKEFDSTSRDVSKVKTAEMLQKLNSYNDSPN